MTKLAGMLFDLDGTLLDTAQDMGNALNLMLSELQRPLVPYEDYRKIASDGAKGMLELGFGEDLQHFDFDQLRQQFLAHYANNICAHTSYFAGVEKMLETLNAKAIGWGIVTNKPENLTAQLLAHFPLLAQCQVIIGGDTLPQRKPHPLPLLHALEQLGLHASQVCYVGDAQRDIEAAKAANMHSVVAEYGYIQHPEAIGFWQADTHIQDPLQLLEYF